jgi:hypothetical protein
LTESTLTLIPCALVASEAPEIQNVRYREDYSYLRNADEEERALLSPWLLLEYQTTRHFSAATSYSVFTAGSFIKDTGRSETIHLLPSN